MGQSAHQAPNDLSALPDAVQVSPGVVRVLGQNPGEFTLQGTNTYIVGNGPQRLVIDTSDGNSAWWLLVQEVLQKDNAEIAEIILTHAHSDHVGGIASIREAFPKAKVRKCVKTYALDICQPCSPDAVSRRGMRKRNCGCNGEVPEDCLHLREGEAIEVGDRCVRVLLTPGHSEDSICLLLESSDGNLEALFTGDTILGGRTSVFADLPAYIHSLSRLVSFATDSGGVLLLPGHGEAVSAAKSVNYLNSMLTMLTKRETVIMKTLREQPRSSISEICNAMYKDIVAAKMAEELVEQHLDDLEGRGLVEQSSSWMFETVWEAVDN